MSQQDESIVATHPATPVVIIALSLCHRPIAERLGRILGVDAASAGVSACIDCAMVPYAAIALREVGGDPDGFLSRRLTGGITGDADLVLTMTRLQRDQVLQINPPALRKTFTIVEAARLAHVDEVTTVAGMGAARPYLSPGSHEDIVDPWAVNSTHSARPQSGLTNSSFAGSPVEDDLERHAQRRHSDALGERRK